MKIDEEILITIIIVITNFLEVIIIFIEVSKA